MSRKLCSLWSGKNQIPSLVQPREYIVLNDGRRTKLRSGAMPASRCELRGPLRRASAVGCPEAEGGGGDEGGGRVGSRLRNEAQPALSGGSVSDSAAFRRLLEQRLLPSWAGCPRSRWLLSSVNSPYVVVLGACPNPGASRWLPCSRRCGDAPGMLGRCWLRGDIG